MSGACRGARFRPTMDVAGGTGRWVIDVQVVKYTVWPSCFALYPGVSVHRR